MNESFLKNVIEAALFAAGRPLTVVQLAQLFDEHVRPATADVRAQLAALAADYETRGIEMKETASGFRVQVSGALAAEISRLWPERPPRFSRASSLACRARFTSSRTPCRIGSLSGRPSSYPQAFSVAAIINSCSELTNSIAGPAGSTSEGAFSRP